MSEDIKSMTLEELTEEIVLLGEKRFVAKQIFSWLHDKRVSSFDEMTDISKDLRRKLKNFFKIYDCTIEKKLCSVYDDTVKYLYRLHDGELIESVVMKYKYGYTICVSSQALSAIPEAQNLQPILQPTSVKRNRQRQLKLFFFQLVNAADDAAGGKRNVSHTEIHALFVGNKM